MSKKAVKEYIDLLNGEIEKLSSTNHEFLKQLGDRVGYHSDLEIYKKKIVFKKMIKLVTNQINISPKNENIKALIRFNDITKEKLSNLEKGINNE